MSYNEISDLKDDLKKKPPQEASSPDINRGDWVTINRKYAKDHGESSLNGKFKIKSRLVRACEVFTDGNSLHEQGYDP